MSMSRRGFLRALAYAVPAAFVLPEVVKTIFLPPTPSVRDSFAEYLKRYLHGDSDTANLQYMVTERYSQGWADPRGTFGSGFGLAPIKAEGGFIAYDPGHERHLEVHQNLLEALEKLRPATFRRQRVSFLGIETKVDKRLANPNSWYLTTTPANGLKDLLK